MVTPVIPRGNTRIPSTRIGVDAERIDDLRSIPSVHAAPPRPSANFIPTADVLDDLIRRALAALSRGVYWDRGSIINILL